NFGNAKAGAFLTPTLRDECASCSNIMKITTNSTEILEWDIQDCEARAAIKSENNSHTFDWIVIKKKDSIILDMAWDEEMLRSIHKAIGGLIDHLDRKRGVGNPALAYPAGVRGDLSP